MSFLIWRSVVVTKMAEFRFSISKFYTKIIFFLSFFIKALYLAKMGHLKKSVLCKNMHTEYRLIVYDV